MASRIWRARSWWCWSRRPRASKSRAKSSEGASFVFVEDERICADRQGDGDVAEHVEGGRGRAGFVAADLGDVDADGFGECVLGEVPFLAEFSESLSEGHGIGEVGGCCGDHTGCSSGGSVIDWVMRAEGVSFRHAVELLRDGHEATRLVSSSGIAKPPKRSSVQKLDGELSSGLSDRDLLDGVIGFLHGDVEGLARRSGLPPGPQVRVGGGDRPVPPGLRQPHARLPDPARPTR